MKRSDSKYRLFNKETREYAKQLEKEAQLFKHRLHKVGDSKNKRPRYDKDYARILYSSSFRRLQGKMQLLGVDHMSFHRNRLTHSLEVAQIARTIATGLELKQPIVSEACSLAHDIGNPPFGHSGEKKLNELSKDFGGYEGNAQVIRIFRSLERKYPDILGLNLTGRTLFGLTKYFYTRDENPKKFLYDDDYKVLNDTWESKQANCRRSIDVQIMDIADEIAYAAHDLEDSLAMGYMSIGELLHEFKIHAKFSDAYESLRDIVKRSQKYSGSKQNVESSEAYSSILQKKLTSEIVNTLIRDVEIGYDQDYGGKLVFKELSDLSRGLKILVFQSVLRKPNVQLYEKTGDIVINGLFQVYSDTCFNKDGVLLPVEYRPKGSDNESNRLVIDYISGMMDSFAISEYLKYFGSNSLDRLYTGRDGCAESKILPYDKHRKIE